MLRRLEWIGDVLMGLTVRQTVLILAVLNALLWLSALPTCWSTQ